MAVDKISTNDSGYVVGDLSVYPSAIDGFLNLYEAKNNSTTVCKSSISMTTDVILVDNTGSFPNEGILKLSLPGKKGTNVEFVYYASKTRNTFYNLRRGFLGTGIFNWPINTTVESGVFAEHHNALKDAVINIETFTGVESSTVDTTVTGLLKNLEFTYMAPTPVFRAYPLQGTPNLTVNFHSFTNRTVNRFFWDFGDGSLSYEKNPVHTYLKEGNFTVQLRVVSETGGQGVATKKNYISVSNSYTTPFGYTIPVVGQASVTEFTFFDQTQGPVLNRLWQFGDGNSVYVDDPNQHVVTHTYAAAGTYQASVLITIEGNITTRVIFKERITVE